MEDYKNIKNLIAVSNFAYNNTIHSVTGYSPNFLMFKFRSRTPLLNYPRPYESPKPMEKVLEETVELYKEVYYKLQQQHAKNMYSHNQHLQHESIKVGDIVPLIRQFTPSWTSAKYLPRVGNKFVVVKSYRIKIFKQQKI